MNNFTRTQELSSQQISSQSVDKMNSFSNMELVAPVTMTTLSRSQERAELQHLNERFATYVQSVRMLGERSGQVDSTAILKTTKSMEVEMHNLKNMYEQELETLRKELESSSHEKATYQVQLNKQMQNASEFQQRLTIESEKNVKLVDEMNAYQRRIALLEAEIQDLKIAASRPRADLEQLQRSVSILTRENETLKHRYEHEQVARQEAETRIQQIMQKSEFNEKVSAERMAEMTKRIEMSASTILSLESKVRDISKTDVSVSELLKQVRDTAEAELRKYQVESEEQYNRNLTVLKTQLDIDTKNMEKMETERSQLRGSLVELQAMIRTLEGQVASLEHQKRTLEDTVVVERNRSADNVRALEVKLREVQEMLVVKMREVTTVREQNIPLMAEIEALKVLMEEEEKRLRQHLMTEKSSMVTTVLRSPLTTNLPPIAPSSPRVSSPRPGLRLAMSASDAAAATTSGEAHAYISGSYNTTTSSTSKTAAGSSTAFNALTHSSNTAYPFYPPPTSPVLPLTAPDMAHNTVTFADESLEYVPESMMPVGVTGTSVDPMFAYPQFEDELDPQLFGYGSRTADKSTYEASSCLNLTRQVSPANYAKSSSVYGEQRQVASTDKKDNDPEELPKLDSSKVEGDRHRNLNLVRSDAGQGHDFFDKMSRDLQQETLYRRPQSSGLLNDQPMSSVYRDYAVSTSSATGDVKIMEVHQDGKYVRLVNDGAQEVDFSGYMIQQNVRGHPVAVFRFPPRTKFPAQSTVTVHAGTKTQKPHKPPQDFVWKEQQKWGSGPECTTILCRNNGQAVAWTTADHRFGRDTFSGGQNDQDTKEGKPAEDDSVAEAGASKSEGVSLKRQKQQPPCLHMNGNAYGSNAGQSRVVYHVNTSNGHSSCQDLVPVAQRSGTTVQRKYVSGVSNQQPSPRGNGKSKKNFLNYLLNDSGLQ